MGGSGSGTPGFGGFSGGSLGNHGGGGGSDAGVEISCVFEEETVLSSPKPDVLKNLQIQDELGIVTKSGKPPIQAVTEDGDIAGTVILTSTNRFLECIQEGYIYVAMVVDINNAMCKVRISIKE